MRENSSREIVLKKIREALINSTPLPFPSSEGSDNLYPQQQEDPAIEFAAVFTRLQGKFSFCRNNEELVSQVNELIAAMKWTRVYCVEPVLTGLFSDSPLNSAGNSTLADCDASITSCEYLVARTGTIVLSSAGESGRTVSVYAPVHICIAWSSQLLYDVKDALKALSKKYGSELPSFISFASGPSRTADIEKTLVTGVHGPKEVYVFLVDQ